MTNLIFFLGRQTELSEYEIQNFLQPTHTEKINNILLMASKKEGFNLDKINKISGSPKVSEELKRFSLNSDKEILNYIKEYLYQFEQSKIKIGIQIYPERNKLEHRYFLNTIKKDLRKNDIKLRYINKNFQNYSNVLTLKEKMTAEKNHEFNLIVNKNEIILSKTIFIQNIDVYTKIDMKRPHKDSVNGMTPPKLSQLLINYTTATEENTNKTIYDPFCGDGTILMIAKLLNYNVVGSDIKADKVVATKENLQWMNKKFARDITEDIFHHDATKEISNEKKFNYIVTEGWLGNIYKDKPKQRDIKENLDNLVSLYTKFLKSIAKHKKCPIGIFIPIINTKEGPVYVSNLIKSTLQQIEYKKVNREKLVYGRSYQIVQREILILKPEAN